MGVGQLLAGPVVPCMCCVEYDGTLGTPHYKDAAGGKRPLQGISSLKPFLRLTTSGSHEQRRDWDRVPNGPPVAPDASERQSFERAGGAYNAEAAARRRRQVSKSSRVWCCWPHGCTRESPVTAALAHSWRITSCSAFRLRRLSAWLCRLCSPAKCPTARLVVERWACGRARSTFHLEGACSVHTSVPTLSPGFRRYLQHGDVRAHASLRLFFLVAKRARQCTPRSVGCRRTSWMLLENSARYRDAVGGGPLSSAPDCQVSSHRPVNIIHEPVERDARDGRL